MKIAVIQTNPKSDFQENLRKSLHFIKKAASKNAQLIILPESFLFMGSESDRRLSPHKKEDGVFEIFANIAKELKIYLIASFDKKKEQELKNQEKYYNTCITFNPNGNVISEYRKLHLFNLKDENGNPLYCESNIYENGAIPKPYTIKINKEEWSALNIICYDIRFPEIIRHIHSPLDIIFVPAAFTWQTGKDHFEILLRARAIENQCFVIACNQTGSYMNNQKRNYGNSMIVDPWGQILARMNEEEGFLIYEISKSDILKSRCKLPALTDRKIF